MGQFVLPSDGVLPLTVLAADKLLSARDGLAALLYLHILRCGGFYALPQAADALGVSEGEIDAAMHTLCRLQLVQPTQEWQTAPVPTPSKSLDSDQPPDYTAADLTREMESGSPFPALVTEVQRRLGKILSTADLKILYGLYDYLALPPEVISLLVTYCVEEAERCYGPGRKPRMRQIEKEAYSWQQKGIDTVDAVTSHLKRLAAWRSEEGQILAALQIRDRAPSASERKYIASWLEMGFSAEAIELAYDKTILKTGSLRWPYLNSILKNWQQKGLYTPEEIEAGDRLRPKASRPASATESNGRYQEDVEWVRAFVTKNIHGKEG